MAKWRRVRRGSRARGKGHTRSLRSLLDGQLRLRRKESVSEDNLQILGAGREPLCSALQQEGSQVGQSIIPADP